MLVCMELVLICAPSKDYAVTFTKRHHVVGPSRGDGGGRPRFDRNALPQEPRDMERKAAEVERDKVSL